MAGFYGDDEQQPTGLLGMLQNPMSQAYLAMILKGLSPHSEIDPQAMVAQAQRLQLAQQERRRADQARREAMEQRERFHQDTLSQRDQQFGLQQSRFENTELQQERQNTLRENAAKRAEVQAGLTPLAKDIIQETGLEPGTPAYRAEYSRRKQQEFAQQQEAIASKAEKEKPLPGESAGRMALIDEYLKRAPAIGTAIDKGDLTGPIDVTAAKAGYGEQGKLHADIESGVDALRRSLTGAGMPASEAEQYTRRYQPSYLDTTKTLRDKHDRLGAELTGMRENILQGRGGQRDVPTRAAPEEAKPRITPEQAKEELLRRRGKL